MTDETPLPPTTPVPLHKIDSKAIARAFDRMPYWPLAHDGGFLAHRAKEGTLTVGDVVAALDALGRVLKQHGEQHEEQVRELAALRAQRAAVREFLGTDQ